MQVEELIDTLREFQYMTDKVDALINGKKYKVTAAYLEDYSDGTYRIVIKGEDK